MRHANLHDPKMPCLFSDSINQRDRENPPAPPFFVLKGDKLIPGWLISRGTGRPKLPKDLCSDTWIYGGGNVRTKSVYFILPLGAHEISDGNSLGKPEGAGIKGAMHQDNRNRISVTEAGNVIELPSRD